MFEEAWCETWTGVAMELGVFDDRDIGKSYWLRDTIHAFANPNKDFVVNKEVLDLIFINGILGENPSW